MRFGDGGTLTVRPMASVMGICAADAGFTGHTAITQSKRDAMAAILITGWAERLAMADPAAVPAEFLSLVFDQFGCHGRLAAGLAVNRGIDFGLLRELLFDRGDGK